MVLAPLYVIEKIMDINCGLRSNHMFQKTQQHGGFTKSLGNDKLVSKIMSSSYLASYRFQARRPIRKKEGRGVG